MNLTEFRNKYSFYTCEDPAKISYDICVLCSGSVIMRKEKYKIMNKEKNFFIQNFVWLNNEYVKNKSFLLKILFVK